MTLRNVFTLMALTAVLVIVPARAQQLSLEQLTNGTFGAKTIAGVRPLNDGERYSQLSSDARQIIARSFKTGEQTDVLFDVATARGDVRLNHIDGYIMSPNEQTILIQTETQRIYRHSFTAVYYLYNVKNRTLERLSDGGPQEVPAFSKDGTMIEMICASIVDDIAGSDVCVDIHSSNIFLRELPQARVNVNTADYLVQYAEMLNIDLVWVHPAATVLESTLAHTLNSLGVKTIVVEMGVGMRITPSYGERLFHGILNLMKNIGMYTGDIDAEITKPILVSGDGVDFVNAEKSGVFLPEQTYGAMLHKGDVIGKIVSALTGEVLSVATAREDGLLMTIRAYPIVYEGSLLARIVVKA